MRIAYLVLAHRNPEQLRRLVQRLGPDAPVFVHLDARVRNPVAASFRSALPNATFVPRHRCYWGSSGLVRATLECIGALARSGIAYDYAMLLSGQDYPIQPRERILGFLDGHRGAEFIESFPLERPNRWTPQGGPFQASRRVRDFHLFYRSHHVSLPIRRRFPSDLVPYGGSQWWCLSRPCVEHVHRFSAERSDVVRYFEHTFIPDESYFQTVVAASPFASKVVQDDLKLAIWNRPAPPYPAVLRSSDRDRLLASPKLFARKFDTSIDEEILDFVDRAMLRA
jgi:hypothetical protein